MSRFPSPVPPVHALLAAGGRGLRLGRDLPKQLLEVAGRPVLAWAVARLQAAGVRSFVVAVPADLMPAAERALAAVEGVLLVGGGATRQDSVERALAACGAAAGDLVLVHDAARAAVHPDDVGAVLAAAAGDRDGAVLGRPVTDTLKRVRDGSVEETLSRDGLFRAETPQVFRRAVLERAYARAGADGFHGTDECSLVERLPGARIAAVAARHPNPKLTYAADLPWMELLLRAERASAGVGR
jgi:2-C-methyl-D-erythritol 4-phosphate cytidylyltransferase